MSRTMIWTLLALFALAAAATGWWWKLGHDENDWPIRWLEVEGDLERISSAQVRAAVADHAARGFFRIDMEGAREAIESLPWVEHAAVSRRWPDALVIELRERRAVARFNDSALIGSDGEVFTVAGTAGMQGLVRLYGPEPRAREVFERWQQLRGLLQAADLEIARLDIDPRGAWRLELGDGRELLLGREQLEPRLQRFLAVRSELARLPEVRRIDLRYPNGLALVTRDQAERELETETGNEADRLADGGVPGGVERRVQDRPAQGESPNHG